MDQDEDQIGDLMKMDQNELQNALICLHFDLCSFRSILFRSIFVLNYFHFDLPSFSFIFIFICVIWTNVRLVFILNCLHLHPSSISPTFILMYFHLHLSSLRPILILIRLHSDLHFEMPSFWSMFISIYLYFDLSFF